MFAIVGLGNPGHQYQLTRHNAGFLAVEQIAEGHQARFKKVKFSSLISQVRFGKEPVLLVKPQTFMNLSGPAVAQLLRHYRIPLTQTLVVCDDLALALGQLRLRGSGSAGGHKGLLSILQQLNTTDLPRLRIGIGRPEAEGSVSDYVLTKFAPTEAACFERSIERAADAALAFVNHGLDYAMNHYN